MTDAFQPGALGPRILRGRFVTLEPLDQSHHEALRRAATPAIFRFMPTPDFNAWLARAEGDAAAGTRLSFAVRRVHDGALVGSTSYFDISAKDARVEIGSTWYGEGAQATAVNPEAKYLLLGNAFEAGCNCVVLRTDAKNARSRAAILKLGARQDGILRANVWMPPGGLREEGYFRDSVVFSIQAAEWPSVRAALEQRLADV